MCRFIFVLLLLAACRGFCGEGEPNTIDAGVQQTKAVVIVCKGTIDNGLLESIKRRSQVALDEGAEYLIFEISTYGGMLNSADEIAKYLILDIGKKVHTVAYVTTEAISAGAMISVSCKDIIMLRNTTIGDCAPIALGGTLDGVEREKVESFTRATFMRAAEANGYPEPLLKAMVTSRIEVYRVENTDTEQFEFFEGDDLPKDANAYDLDNRERIVDGNELLTLTASQALEYEVARAVVDSRQEALAFLAERDGVEFASQPMILETSWSEEMVRWLNAPAVMSILIMIAMLGVYMELSTPGLGLPGLAAVICFAIIIGSKFLVDMANWVEVALLVAGLALLFVELFVLPGFGIAGTLGIACVFAGLLGMLVKNAPGELPIPRDPVAWELFVQGVLSLVFGTLGFLVLAVALGRFLPKLKMFSGLSLSPSLAGGGMKLRISKTTPPGEVDLELKVGDIGEVTATLRPAGKARFDRAIVDVVALADFIDKGATVEITEIHGNRVIVRVLDNSDGQA